MPGPVLIEAVIDPFEPPMPPKIAYSHAKHFSEAMLRGQPGRNEILKTIMKDKIREVI